MIKLNRKYTYVKLITIVSCSLFAGVISAQTLITKNNEAIDNLTSALNDAKARLTVYEEQKETMTLDKTSTDKDGNILKHQLEPIHFTNASNTEKWQLIQNDEDFSQTIDVSDDLFFDGSTINVDKVKLKSESSSSWVFSIPNNINVETDNNEQISEQDMISIDAKIAQHLYTEVIVDKASNQIKSLKIYAKNKFKPSMMVTIEKFELRLDYQEAWLGGPLIRQNFTRHIKGSYGWLIKIEDLITTRLSNIKKII